MTASISRSETVADHLNWLLLHGVGHLRELTSSDGVELQVTTQVIEERLKSLDERLQVEANALGRIHELLHPNGDPDYEWPVELIEEIATVVYTVFPRPTKELTVEGLMARLRGCIQGIQDYDNLDDLADAADIANKMSEWLFMLEAARSKEPPQLNRKAVQLGVTDALSDMGLKDDLEAVEKITHEVLHQHNYTWLCETCKTAMGKPAGCRRGSMRWECALYRRQP